jgi:hypothetical protein
MRIERIFWVFLTLFLVGLFVYKSFFHSREIAATQKEYSQFLNAISDTVVQYRNENNELVSRISVIQMNSYKDFIGIKFKDSLITELQKEVAYYKDRAESITKFNLIGEAKGSSPTKVDTIYIDTLRVSAIYTSHYLDSWISLYTKASIDSTVFDLKFTDDLLIVQLHDKYGDYIEIRNKSIYNKVDKVITYRIKSPVIKSKKWGVGVQIGYGISHINNDLKLSPYFGIGVSYNLFNW